MSFENSMLSDWLHVCPNTSVGGVNEQFEGFWTYVAVHITVKDYPVANDGTVRQKEAFSFPNAPGCHDLLLATFGPKC